MAQEAQYETYAQVKARLDEIVEAVKDENLPLDDALDLYEEAVTLGLRVSDMLEDDVEEGTESATDEGAGAGESAGTANGNETGAAQSAAAESPTGVPTASE